MAAKRRGLGARDLDALLGNKDDDENAAAEVDGELRMLPLTTIQAGKYQPRRHWDQDRLDELAASIKAQGLIQPVVVRSIGRNRYELIAGERRWRAAKIAGLNELPALVRKVSDKAAPALALIENIQRQDLSPLEEAQAMQRLLSDFKLTHQQVADAVGRSRASVSNLLRLLELPAAISKLLDDGQLQMGHARALLTLPAPLAKRLAQQAAEQEWSVRQLEQAARNAQAKDGASKQRKPSRDADVEALERELSEQLGTTVRFVSARGGRGKLVIQYHDPDQLEGVLDRLRREV